MISHSFIQTLHDKFVRIAVLLIPAVILFAIAVSCARAPTAQITDKSRSISISETRVQTPDEEQELSADKIGKNTQDSLFDSLLRPFVYEAFKRREDRTTKDPEFVKRIDKELNEGRINFLLFGYGETHEPPATERALIGSDTIISYDTRTRTADIVSLTHDIRAPEIEQELRARGNKVLAVKIDQAYNVGGFRLMRKVLEDATGLAIDFQITFRDIAIQKFVDNVFGGAEVDVPEDFKVHPFYLEGKKYPAAQFKKGIQILNGTQVIQFIKTVPVTQGYYGKSLEHNTRKHVIFQALLAALSKHSSEKAFWLKGTAFLTSELVTGEIVYDFDPASLAVNNIGSIASDLGKYVNSRQASGIEMPKIRKTKYLCDPTCGDGGVRWVDGDIGNPNTQRDMQKGIYPNSAGMEIPYDANAEGDLILEYWPSVRSLIKNILVNKEPSDRER